MNHPQGEGGEFLSLYPSVSRKGYLVQHSRQAASSNMPDYIGSASRFVLPVPLVIGQAPNSWHSARTHRGVLHRAPEWVQEKCFKFATHPGEAALRGAAIVLGSIAFVRGPIDFLRSVATLIKDASVAGMPSPGVCMRIVTDTHQ
jgi:hypothetical protein